MTTFLRFAAVFFCLGFTAFARSSEPTEEPMVTRANAWKLGMPVPKELLRYRDSTAWEKANLLVCSDPVFRSDDSFLVFYSITNYPLLRVILFTAHDQRIFDLADKRALLVGGPRRFYDDLTAELRRQPTLLSQKRFLTLNERAHQRQVIVRMLYANNKDLSPKQADTAFKQTAADLRAGMTFDQAALRCQKAHPMAADPLSSRVADCGDDVLVGPKPTEMFGSGIAASTDAPRLMQAQTGDTFVVYNKKSERTIFYAVGEVYAPDEQTAPRN